jgi:Rrf2 family nitric oxide-sensitive transcriptional repressor
MRLTAFTDYTLRTLTYLALRPGRMATIAEIASAYTVSANHLMKVVQQLALAGDIETVRGQHGGLRLARRPEHINIGAVVCRTEPDLAMAACFCGEERCAIQGECILARALDQAIAAFVAVLERYTLADLTQDAPPLCRLLGIPEDDGTR